jgi:hypothetical protein
MAQVAVAGSAGAPRWVEDRLTFTPHALVRYIERYVDGAFVRALRRARLSDCRNVTSGLSYRLHLGQVRIVVCCGVCLTTLPVMQ